MWRSLYTNPWRIFLYLIFQIFLQTSFETSPEIRNFYRKFSCYYCDKSGDYFRNFPWHSGVNFWRNVSRILISKSSRKFRRNFARDFCINLVIRTIIISPCIFPKKNLLDVLQRFFKEFIQKFPKNYFIGIFRNF